MPLFTDQLKRKIELPSVPLRIISLVPSQTELLYDLGLRDEVIGITKFCIHPGEWFRNKTRVGGTKKFDFEKIRKLQPDLIIGNKEENEKNQIEELMQEYNVWMSDIYDLKDAYEMITSMGAVVGKVKESVNLKLEIESNFNALVNSEKKFNEIRTGYFIWKDPYIAAGHSTFINEMMKICGFKNVFAEENSRYPEISYQQIQEADPELILLSSEPYPFREKHIEEFKKMLPDSKIRLVDGEAFSWYGSRLKTAPDYFRQLIKEISS